MGRKAEFRFTQHYWECGLAAARSDCTMSVWPRLIPRVCTNPNLLSTVSQYCMKWSKSFAPSQRQERLKRKESDTRLNLSHGLFLLKWMLFLRSTAWVYFHPRWSGWSPDWQCMLGTVLPGTWDPAGWTDAQWQDNWGWRWFLQHLFQWDWSWETCPQGCFCGPGTHGHRYASSTVELALSCHV